jgi:hypothetical protein
MIGLPPPRYVPHIAVLNTGAGPNLIRQDILPIDCEYLGLAIPGVCWQIIDANGNVLSAIGSGRLSCQVGGLGILTDFTVVERLAVPLILGCDFIDNHILSIRPIENIIELRKHFRACFHRAHEPVDDFHRYISVSRRCTLELQSETNVLVTTAAHGCYGAEHQGVVFYVVRISV